MTQTMTVTLIPTRKVIRLVVRTVEHDDLVIPLPADTTDINVSNRIRPLIGFPDYVSEFTGPKNASTIVVAKIESDLPFNAALRNAELLLEWKP